MSRITGTDAANLIEAYNAVYAPQEEVELTEEQVQEDFENWVNSLVEEGHDLSEYTWEDMYEVYLNEDLIGDLRANAGRVVRGVQSAAASANRAAGAVNQAMVNRIRQNVPQGSFPGTRPQQTFQNTNGFGRYAPPSMQQRTPAPAAPARPAAPAARPAARPVAQAAKPVSTPTPAATPAAPAAPAAPARTFNPLMQRTFGYQTGNAPDQVAAASKNVSQATSDAAFKRSREMRQKLQSTGTLSQSLDLFDIIKGHLLEEGYADTEEAALQIMANMSEEWKQSILEAPMNPAELERIAQQASTEVTGKRKKPKMKRPAGMRE